MTDDAGNNYVQFAFVRGEWSATIRGDSPEMLAFLMNGTFGDGSFDGVVNTIGDRIGKAATDRGVVLLQQGGLAATPVADSGPTPPSFVPVAANTPTAQFGSAQPAVSTKPIDLGASDQGFKVILWPDGKFGPNVALLQADGKTPVPGPDGKGLRATLKKGEDPASVDLNRALQLLAERQQYVQSKQG